MSAMSRIGAAGLACLAAGLLCMLEARAEEIPGAETPEAIVAVLEAKCFPCHGPENQKSELRLDSLEAAQKGGKSGKPALAPGDAFSSELIRRISLPAEHADVMPPSGKTALTPEETIAIMHWVNRGAPWIAVAAAPDSSAPAAEPAAVAGVSFATHIQPILEASCYKCHGAERQKADLRLDSPEAIQQGSENGAVFTAGKPDDSPLFSLVVLPADHPDVMPAQGDPLTAEQTELIRRWILEGAVFDAAAVVAAAPEAPKGPTFEEVLAALAEGVSPASPDTLAAFDGWGVLALPLDQKTPLLQIDFQRAASGVGDEQLSQLETLANQVTWLNLAGTDISDDDLAQVAKLKNLTKLHLERTAISDAGLQHLCTLANLQYLNLYGTKVTDAGLATIELLPQIKKVFLWQTKVTNEGAAQLAAAKPGLLIDLGWEEPESEESAEATPTAFDEGGCCATAAAEGKECEHPCCVEARATGTVCAKCNPNTAAAQAAPEEPAPTEPAPAEAAAAFDEGGCCALAAAQGKECDHPCCVEARAAGKVCAKCNPNSAA